MGTLLLCGQGERGIGRGKERLMGVYFKLIIMKAPVLMINNENVVVWLRM